MVEMQTYRITSPIATHWKVASCEDSGCSAFFNGWRTVVDETTTLGQQRAHYIRTGHRRYSESRNSEGETEFLFVAGQVCFNTVEQDGRIQNGHFVPLDRPELYLVASNGSIRRHSGADAWVDDLCANQSALSKIING